MTTPDDDVTPVITPAAGPLPPIYLPRPSDHTLKPLWLLRGLVRAARATGSRIRETTHRNRS